MPTATRLLTAARRSLAVWLRSQGRTYPQIGAALGVTGPAARYLVESPAPRWKHGRRKREELAGRVFGRLRVLVETPDRPLYWDCYCDPDLGGCGAVAPAVRGDSLRRGLSQSCGCLRAERVRGSPNVGAPEWAEDLTGREFGRWTVARRAVRTEPGAAVWVCRCRCGRTGEVQASALRAARSTRCRVCTRGATWDKVCVRCGKGYVGTTRQRYCDARCREAA